MPFLRSRLKVIIATPGLKAEWVKWVRYNFADMSNLNPPPNNVNRRMPTCFINKEPHDFES